MMKKYSSQKGFTLLLSLLVSAVIMTVGLGIFNIVFRELLLSGLSKDSEMSFFAADLGIECASYWDLKKGAIATANGSAINCASQEFAIPPVELIDGKVVRSQMLPPIYLNDANHSGPCAIVEIDYDQRRTWPERKMSIKSRGYNTCDQSSSRRIERAIEFAY